MLAEVPTRLGVVGGYSLMSSATAGSKACPLCGLPAATDLNEDHVFGDAFGARSTVTAHRTCNTRFSEAEGRLHRANSFFNFARAVHGLAKLPLDAETPTGDPLRVDLHRGQVWPGSPEVTVNEDEGQLHLSATGSEAQVRRVLANWRKKWGPQIPRFDDLPAEAREQIQWPVDEVRLAVSWELPAGEQFAAKAALGAGVLAYGSDFASSDLAKELRDWAAAPFDNPMIDDAAVRDRCGLGAITAMSRYAQDLQQRIQGSAPQLPDMWPAPASRTYQVLFMPVTGSKPPSTTVFVHVLGAWVMPWGIVVPAGLPHGQFGAPVLPVLVREDPHGLHVVHYTDLVMHAAAEASARAWETIRAQEQGGPSSDPTVD